VRVQAQVAACVYVARPGRSLKPAAPRCLAGVGCWGCQCICADVWRVLQDPQVAVLPGNSTWHVCYGRVSSAELAPPIGVGGYLAYHVAPWQRVAGMTPQLGHYDSRAFMTVLLIDRLVAALWWESHTSPDQHLCLPPRAVTVCKPGAAIV
jgi:hypothetical protein